MGRKSFIRKVKLQIILLIKCQFVTFNELAFLLSIEKRQNKTIINEIPAFAGMTNKLNYGKRKY